MPELSNRRRVMAGAAAFVLLMLASWLLLRAGLPQRSDYTGVNVAAIGRVAPEVGSLTPPIDAPTLDGDGVNLQALRGDSVVINFWATWCVPCRREMPELQSLHEDTGVRILAVNLAESPAVIEQWVDEFGLTLTIVLDSRGRIAEQYRLRGQPTTYVIAPDGIITHIYYGATTEDALHAALLTHTGDNDA